MTSPVSLRIAVLSSFTADFLPSFLEKEFSNGNYSLEFYVGGIGRYHELVLDPQSAYYAFRPTHTLLLLDGADIFRPLFDCPFNFTAEQIANSVQDQILLIKNWLEHVEKAMPNHVTLLHTIVAPPRTPLRLLESTSDLSLHRVANVFNRAMKDLCHSGLGRFLVDMAAVATEVGYGNWGDDRLWILARMRLSRTALARLAHVQASFIHSLCAGRKKCLVLDLDNTLWGGIIGEDGIDGIALGTEGVGLAFRQFQSEILNLHKQGILLAICSKNNESDVLEVFNKHPGMLLKWDDFSDIRINWENKGSNLRAIAQRLNIGLDSLVFADDNPVEREHIRQALPEVRVLELPTDPSYYKKTLLECTWFDTLALTEEDARRNQVYRQEQQRRTLEESTTSLDDYHTSLGMVVNIKPAVEMTIPRISQLTQKTNQFNLTTRRYSEPQIKSFCLNGQYRLYTLNFRDRFGDEGLVGVAILADRPSDNAWYLDTFLLSCRVIGRNVETAFLNWIVKQARKEGKAHILAELIVTPKNAAVQKFLALHHFIPPHSTETLWRLPLKNVPDTPASIKVDGE